MFIGCSRQKFVFVIISFCSIIPSHRDCLGYATLLIQIHTPNHTLETATMHISVFWLEYLKYNSRAKSIIQTYALNIYTPKVRINRLRTKTGSVSSTMYGLRAIMCRTYQLLNDLITYALLREKNWQLA